MTEIRVDREEMDALLDDHIHEAEAIEAKAKTIPSAPDGGIATSLIAYITAAGAEASMLLAGSHRLIEAVARHVLDDLQANEELAESEINDLLEQVNSI